MRLVRVKLSGFKSFVDPTSIAFPSNLTGVVGPNGCGKSNVIDAVRWVMGELSAKHLRGDSMTDVIFNGSGARKPVGAASVELVFDNSDGKISGPYAAYSEISLRRLVSRDGSSSYFINGSKCRRKDITQLFLGTGLGSRSYAIIEQGMISRVIEAKTEDMRAFVEEAAGISRYKERRRETESRIRDTRENLERLQDVRDEVDKQIRHLQRQAATARRYQTLKEEERKLHAELLALRLRELDSGSEVQDSAVRACDIALQSALAELRSSEAALETQRQFQVETTERVGVVQGRYYTIGADVSRHEQQIQHTRELRERQRAELAQLRTSLGEMASHIARDESELVTVRNELESLAPGLGQAGELDLVARAALVAAESELQRAQQFWEQFNAELGGARQTVQVERARIEQLENQIRRLQAHADRLSLERDGQATQEANALLGDLASRESLARQVSEDLTSALSAALGDVQSTRGQQLRLESELESARVRRDKARADMLSVEALQQASLRRAEGNASGWLATHGLAKKARLAESLTVESGWERAVETVLGDYLEAVCVDNFDSLESALAGLGDGRLALLDSSGRSADAVSAGLAQHARGPSAVLELLSHVQTAGSLAQALAMRSSLPSDQSVVTARGEWLGRNWLRINRGAGGHEGVLEREHRLKDLRVQSQQCDSQVSGFEQELAGLRATLLLAERQRDLTQAQIQSAHRDHSELLGQLEASRARSQETLLRRQRLDQESAEVIRERDETQLALERAHAELERGLAAIEDLDRRQPELLTERETRRDELQRCRDGAEQAQLALRDLMIRSEGRRSTEGSLVLGLGRMADQRQQLDQRVTSLESELVGGDAPIVELEGLLQGLLAKRVDVEAEFAAARRSQEDADSEMRRLDESRLTAERRVTECRTDMETARMAAQETRVRRESIAEQFAVTNFVLADVLGGLSEEANTTDWDKSLVDRRQDIEKLGQVNLAAIDELRDNTERKEYLDSQFTDLTSALDTLEAAMRKIDKETRVRFEETFERINVGLKEKFPRLFGGGHAYLELVGDDPLNAGVAVMARPPGKRNVTISQLSGGEKALTAVALVFAIFELNPAPFCLLDEVDAPLDEHNVGRFCEIVREMAQRVQFIFITHNKTTMELASQLLGVTMSEPGVSRLVSVDIDEALRMAAS